MVVSWLEDDIFNTLPYFLAFTYFLSPLLYCPQAFDEDGINVLFYVWALSYDLYSLFMGLAEVVTQESYF